MTNPIRMKKMLKILIIESNTNELHNRDLSLGRKGNAESYMDVLISCESSLDISIARPYFSGFNLKELNFDEIDGLVFTGSSVPWSTHSAKCRVLHIVMEKAFSEGKPVLGSCNGLQLGAVVLGGRVGVSPKGLEVGLARDIRLTKEGENHSFHSGRPRIFSAPCIHRDEVIDLPTGAVITASNDHSQVQGMVYEHQGVIFWAVQYHPEASTGTIANVIETSNVFSSSSSLVTDLRLAEVDNQGHAARRLGAIDQDLAPYMRTKEIGNWLDMIKRLKDN